VLQVIRTAELGESPKDKLSITKLVNIGHPVQDKYMG
jgi:hypothetical protein